MPNLDEDRNNLVAATVDYGPLNVLAIYIGSIR